MKSIKQQLEELRDGEGAIRNLAFYKEGNSSFTQEEFKKISDFVGIDRKYPYCRATWIFDDSSESFSIAYSDWVSQGSHPNFNLYKKVKYADVFGIEESKKEIIKGKK